MNTYKKLIAALRNRFNTNNDLLAINESHCTDDSIYADLRESYQMQVVFAFRIEDDKLYFSAVPRETARTNGESIDLAGYSDLELADKPLEFLNDIIESIWQKMALVVCGEVIARMTPAAPKNPVATPQNTSSLYFSMPDTEGLKPAFERRIFRMDDNFDGFRSYAPPVLSEEPQDVNHNQEVLYALLNEALGNQRPIFSDSQQNKFISTIAKKELSKFRLYGMVLWDKDRDSDLEDVITRKYASLQDAASEYFKLLLLFSRSRKIYKDADDEYHWDELFADVTRKIANDAYYMQVFLDALDIAEHDIPYLVTTKSFTSNDILLIPLKGVKLLRLVEDIGELAKSESISLEQYQQELHQRGYISEVRSLADRSFGMRLIGPMTRIMQNSHTGIRIQCVQSLLNRAYEEILHSRNTMRRAFAEIDSLDHDSVEYQEYYQSYETLCMQQLNHAVMNVEQVVNYNNCEFSREMIEGLHKESKINLITAIRAMGLYDYFRNDVAPITIALGKMFENEMNHSMVQLIRKQLRIPMPNYFYEFYPYSNGDGDYTIGSTDFNRTKSGTKVWLPPELGNTQTAVYKRKDIWERMQEDYPFVLKNARNLSRDTLCSKWRTICLCRNAAAHPDMNGHTLENLDNMKKTILELEGLGCFRFLKGLRERLAPGMLPR